ncbi:MAG: 2-amino-4-hydroxy-6-hydroxymethyldihydropteridine diphosphokinase [Deltaproteobacteria bacterium]|nr:2-amino-4-hydroxy-6-hydroxymethyldihydropteridine diphosphokinase [Deltaproteobacteria bacterium]
MARAVRSLDELGQTRVARLYRTAPIGPTQPEFLNSAVELLTELGPEALLDRVLKIEADLGRQRRERWGPRVIDLDILVGGAPFRSARLVMPHPELASRRFALSPLAELYSGEIPGLGLTAGELLGRLPDEGVRVVEDVEWVARRCSA